MNSGSSSRKPSLRRSPGASGRPRGCRRRCPRRRSAAATRRRRRSSRARSRKALTRSIAAAALCQRLGPGGVDLDDQGPADVGLGVEEVEQRRRARRAACLSSSSLPAAAASDQRFDPLARLRRRPAGSSRPCRRSCRRRPAGRPRCGRARCGPRSARSPPPRPPRASRPGSLAASGRSRALSSGALSSRELDAPERRPSQPLPGPWCRRAFPSALPLVDQGNRLSGFRYFSGI